MREQLLKLVPKKFLCPYCGKWHDCGESRKLNSGDTFIFKCSRVPETDYQITFKGGICFYSFASLCDMFMLSSRIKDEIPVSSIIEWGEPWPTRAVTFRVPFESAEEVGTDECPECTFKNECIYARLGDKGDHRHISITLGFEFDQEEYDEICGKGEKISKTTRRVPGKEDNVSKNIRRIVT